MARTMTRASRTALLWLVGSLGLTAVAVLAEGWAGPRGLTLTVHAERGGTVLPPQRVAAVDLRDLYAAGPLPSDARSARWQSVWRPSESGRCRIVAQGRGSVAVLLDGREVLAGQQEGRLKGRADLDAGFHPLLVRYELAEGPDQLRLRWSCGDAVPQDLEPDSLFVRAPTPREQSWRERADALRWLAVAAWTLPPLALALVALRSRVRTGQWPNELRPAWWQGAAGRRVRRGLAIALPAAVVVYGGALRFEALVGRYAWDGPRWAQALARGIERSHPDALRFEPEREITGGDPFHYVGRARAMRGFYDANAREPLFPALTGVLLRPLDGRLLAVHAASALCSTLVVLATFLLGAAAFSRAVGLGAALVMAVERDALWWSVEGFRDDAFTLFVVLSALALVRLHQRPTVLRAALAGLAGAAACLTRLTALSFLLPALAWLLSTRGEQAWARRKAVGVSALVLLAVVGPFLLSCAIAFGDPFYAVNFHTRFYRSRSGMPFGQPMGWLDYLGQGSTLAEQGWRGLQGLTTYPFGSKWNGIEYLSPWLARGLSVACIAGLALFLTSPAGRLLLIVLFSSLLPYAFTWTIPGGAEWRFTMHAYPFYLIASWLAITRAVRQLRRAD